VTTEAIQCLNGRAGGCKNKPKVAQSCATIFSLCEEMTMTPQRTSRSFEGFLNADQELTILRQKVKQLKRNPDQARAVMARAGICTLDGRLTKAFGGKA
jgi:hypothetical protein